MFLYSESNKHIYNVFYIHFTKMLTDFWAIVFIAVIEGEHYSGLSLNVSRLFATVRFPKAMTFL
jgi:hypothetical protein